MDPVNKLYCFDWMILINTEYVVYSMCVCRVPTVMESHGEKKTAMESHGKVMETEENK